MNFDKRFRFASQDADGNISARKHDVMLLLTYLFLKTIYSRPSMARTLMARLPRLFRTRF